MPCRAVLCPATPRRAAGGLGRWDEAVGYYGKASELAPNFSFAAANKVGRHITCTYM